MRTRLVLFVVAAFVVIANAGPSTAEPITVGYSGVIGTVDDPLGLIPGVVPGTTFSGTYTLDPDLFTTTGPLGFFISHTPGPGSVEVDIGGNLFSRVVDIILIGDNSTFFGPDIWLLRFTSDPPPPTPGVLLLFQDSTGTRISDPTSFIVNTSLDGWDIAVMVLSVGDPTAPSGTRNLAGGTITDVFVIPESSPVPSLGPLALLILALGLLAMGVRARRAV